MNMKVVLKDQPVQQLETAEAFVEAMARAVTPVSIVTTDGKAGRFGVTVSAVNSVSAAPPMVLGLHQQAQSGDRSHSRKRGVFHQHAECWTGSACRLFCRPRPGWREL